MHPAHDATIAPITGARTAKQNRERHEKKELRTGSPLDEPPIAGVDAAQSRIMVGRGKRWLEAPELDLRLCGTDPLTLCPFVSPQPYSDICHTAYYSGQLRNDFQHFQKVSAFISPFSILSEVSKTPETLTVDNSLFAQVHHG